MLTTRLRNGKGRLISWVILLMGFGVIFYLLRNVHIKLNEARETSEKCHQKHESLSAQLQVMREQSSRLDESLQFEIEQHKKTKEDLEAHYQQKHDKERKEASNRLNSLQQQYKMLQTQVEDLQDELQKSQQTNNNLIDEKQQLNDKLVDQIQTQKQNEKSIEEFRIATSDCKSQLKTVNDEMLYSKFTLGKIENQLAVCRSGLKEQTNDSVNATKTIFINNIKSFHPKQNPIKDDKQNRLRRNNVDSKARNNKSIKVDDDDNVKIGKEENKPSDDLLQQLAPPNPPNAMNHESQNVIHKPDEDEESNRGIQEEFRGNGLEQQENGEDQDLDNMEDEEGEGAGIANRKEKDDGKVFEDADFDQLEWH